MRGPQWSLYLVTIVVALGGFRATFQVVGGNDVERHHLGFQLKTLCASSVVEAAANDPEPLGAAAVGPFAVVAGGIELAQHSWPLALLLSAGLKNPECCQGVGFSLPKRYFKGVRSVKGLGRSIMRERSHGRWYHWVLYHHQR